jgi:calcineurin-like phosphoesterase family protein
MMTRLRLLTIVSGMAIVFLCWPSGAFADVCSSVTSSGTTATICVATIQAEGGTPVSPNGSTVTVSGATTITATVSYSRPRPSGEVRGCPGERLTPSGCVTWMTNGAYTLTHLYKTPGTNLYRWRWYTSQYPNGGRNISAQTKLNGNLIAATVPVQVSNSQTGLPSPVPTGGKIPSFGQTTPFVIAAVGDATAGSTSANSVYAMVSGWQPNMLMYLGDVYQRGMKDEFLNFYQPLYGQLATKTAPTIGNHEYKQRPHGEDYFWYWKYPQGGPTTAGGGGGWYSFNAGGWHIISLNNNLDDLGATTPQGLWLRSDLAADTHKCTLAFWHGARFSDISLRRPSTSAFWNPLYADGADIIVNAHSHAYERWKPLNAGGSPDAVKGITEFVVGTGGNVLAQVWDSNDPRSAFRTNTHFGALKLTLNASSATYQFESPGSGVLDTGTIPCH